jgi:hypothetical protein
MPHALSNKRINSIDLLKGLVMVIMALDHMRPVLIFLGNTERLKGRVVNFFTTFGQVPFFYYLLHLYVIHLFAALYGQLSGWGWKLLVLPDWVLELPTLKGYGTNLVGVYLVWLLVIAITYHYVNGMINIKAAKKRNGG